MRLSKELMLYIIACLLIILVVLASMLLYSYVKEMNQLKAQITTEQTVNFDRKMLDALHILKIKPTDVQRVSHPNAIYYYVPMGSLIEINQTDRIMTEQLEHSNIVLNELIKSDDNQLIKSYYDRNSKQMFILDLHYYVPQPRVVTTGKPQLCIIVDDFGNFDGPLIDAFCALEQSVTFAIIPGLPFSKIAMQKAVNTGHEVIIHIPMQPENDSTNPGANAITTKMSDKEIYERVKSFFAEITVAKGANQHMGSLITQDRTLLRSALKYFAEKDYFFIDSRTTPNTVALEVAKSLGIAFEERNLFIDAPENTDAVLTDRLADLKRLMDSKNRALVITHCHDRGRLDRLKKFMVEAKKMGFEIVPASKYVRNSEV